MTKSSPVTASAAEAAQELRVVFSRIRRKLREIGAEEGLTPSQTSVLSRLSKEGPASASVLAAAERVRPQSMAATLGALEEQGLIRRDPDPTDGRRQQVSLTPAGRSRAEGDRAARQEWLAREMQSRFTEAERATMIEALRLIDRLTQS
ncbi:MarR family winged helix-turn-helix transcriptional regulator [Streptacidiphilus monticola]|jgi:DNA-binding MarR family transcriptional regulator|uniref:MarR family winged helix-turn-helix transcriptional regulator n=1 Tax=Streptacidiphilus monticola TaxID=2161674 RepID=A0ABW1GCA9_9ACTN